MTTRPRRLIILEGCDGTGKTTLGKRLAAWYDAEYIHLDAMLSVTGRGLPRMSLEAMTPALLGHRAVVMDRSWLSELPYGIMARNGDVRISDFDRRMLDRLALTCNAVVINCSTDLDTMLANWQGRKKIELVKQQKMITRIWNWYGQNLATATDLPVIDYDYQQASVGRVVDQIEVSYPLQHDALTVIGSQREDSVLVVDCRSDPTTDFDSFRQWPCVSFGTGAGSHTYSRYVANHLIHHEVPEHVISWTTTAQLEKTVKEKPFGLFKKNKIITLGSGAWESVMGLSTEGLLRTYNIAEVFHPQDALIKGLSYKDYNFATTIKQMIGA
jgi:thymidylate kinase